jgi:hypothetical protein
LGTEPGFPKFIGIGSTIGDFGEAEDANEKHVAKK